MLQVFGLDNLSESELDRALEIAYDDWPGLDVIEDWVVYKDSTKREYLEFWGSPPFWQPGGLSDRCNIRICPSVNTSATGGFRFPFVVECERYCGAKIGDSRQTLRRRRR